MGAPLLHHLRGSVDRAVVNYHHLPQIVWIVDVGDGVEALRQRIFLVACSDDYRHRRRLSGRFWPSGSAVKYNQRSDQIRNRETKSDDADLFQLTAFLEDGGDRVPPEEYSLLE